MRRNCRRDRYFQLLGFGDVFGEAGFDEFADEGGGEWFFGMEADGAFAGVVVLEEVAVGFDGGAAHEVEGAVVFGGAVGDEGSVLAEGAELVADAFFGFWGGSFDGLAKFFEGGTLGWRKGGEVGVVGLWFGGGGHGKG